MSERCKHFWESVGSPDNLFRCKYCGHMKLITEYTDWYDRGSNNKQVSITYLKPSAMLKDGQLVVVLVEYDSSMKTIHNRYKKYKNGTLV